MTITSAILGEGSFSTVYKLVNREGTFAAKVAKVGFEECILEECEMLRYLEVRVGFATANIIKTFGMSNGKFAGVQSDYLKFEFHEMTLLEYVSKQGGSLSLEKTAKITQELTKALVFISAAGVIHADIKPNNILVSGDRVVLTDFGSAVLTGKAQSENWGQCLLYRSPEVVLDIDPTPAIDVWSLAVVIAEVYVKNVFFASNTMWLIIYHQTRLKKPYSDDFMNKIKIANSPGLYTIITDRIANGVNHLALKDELRHEVALKSCPVKGPLL